MTPSPVEVSEAAAPARTAWPRPLAALAVPGFRLIFVNGLFASVGMTANLLMQSWLVLSLTDDSPFWVGVSVLLSGLGRIVFSVVGGVLGDLFERRRVVMTAQFLNAGFAAVIAVTSYLGVINLPIALIVSLGIGAALSVDSTVTSALIFDVVGRERVLNGVSLRRITTVPMMIGGSLLMGFLLASVGIWAAYAVLTAALFIAPWVLLWLRSPQRLANRRREPFFALAAEGMRFAARDGQIRTLLLVAVGMEAFGFSYLTMIPVMAKNVLDVGAIGLGQIAAASGAGAGLAVLGVASLGNFRNKPLLLFCTAMGAGAALLGFSLARSLPLSMLCALLTTGCLTAYDITIGSLFQLVAPERMRGRIISLHNLVLAFTSVGGFVSGAIGTLIGVPVMLTLSSGAIVANLLVHRARLLRVRETGRDHPTSF